MNEFDKPAQIMAPAVGTGGEGSPEDEDPA